MKVNDLKLTKVTLCVVRHNLSTHACVHASVFMYKYAQPLIGSAQLISKPSVPRYSIGHDTHNRESPSVTHIPVAGLGMIGTNTDLAQRPQVSRC